MKLKEDFVLRQVANTWVVLPLGDTALDFTSMVKLNDSGALLWQVLENTPSKDALVSALIAEYDVTAEVAKADVEEFLKVLLDFGCLEQD